jgi:hypothetical protein
MSAIRHLPLPTLFAAAVIAAGVTVTQTAHAGMFSGDAGRTAVWVYIRKSPDEGIWEACRRVYRRDVYQVRGAGPRKARCFVDASEVGNPRGFNTSRELD